MGDIILKYLPFCISNQKLFTEQKKIGRGQVFSSVQADIGHSFPIMFSSSLSDNIIGALQTDMYAKSQECLKRLFYK